MSGSRPLPPIPTPTRRQPLPRRPQRLISIVEEDEYADAPNGRNVRFVAAEDTLMEDDSHLWHEEEEEEDDEEENHGVQFRPGHRRQPSLLRQSFSTEDFRLPSSPSSPTFSYPSPYSWQKSRSEVNFEAAKRKKRTRGSVNFEDLSSAEKVDPVDHEATALPHSRSFFSFRGASTTGESAWKPRVSGLWKALSKSVDKLFPRRKKHSAVSQEITQDDAAEEQKVSLSRETDVVPLYGTHTGTVGGISGLPLPEVSGYDETTPFSEEVQARLPIRGSKLPRVNPLRMHGDVMSFASPPQ